MLTLFLLTASLIFPLLCLFGESALRLLPFPCWIVSIWQDFIPPPTHCGASSSKQNSEQRHKQRRDNEQFQRAGLREETEREQHHCHDRARRALKPPNTNASKSSWNRPTSTSRAWNYLITDVSTRMGSRSPG